jgi:anti-anti-sigma regulatory factor
VVVHGGLDVTTAGTLRAALTALLNRGGLDTIGIDLREVDLAAPAAVGTLVAAQRICHDMPVQLRVTAAGPVGVRLLAAATSTLHAAGLPARRESHLRPPAAVVEARRARRCSSRRSGRNSYIHARSPREAQGERVQERVCSDGIDGLMAVAGTSPTRRLWARPHRVDRRHHRSCGWPDPSAPRSIYGPDGSMWTTVITGSRSQPDLLP